MLRALKIAMLILASLFILGPIILCAGCGMESGTSQQVGIPITSKPIKSNTGRFSVTYQGFFAAGKEDYKMNRAVYTIIDNSTGQEYIGIEGVGVSACRLSGKYTVAE